MLQQYPEADPTLEDAEAEADVAWLKQVVTGVRNIRGEMDISPAKPVPVLFAMTSVEDRDRIERLTQLLTFLTNPESMVTLAADDTKPLAATALVGEMELLVPMAGLIDQDAELARLDKEIDKKQKDHDRTANKLNNPSFVEKAPEDVVQKEKDKLADAISALQKLKDQRVRVAEI